MVPWWSAAHSVHREDHLILSEDDVLAVIE